MGVMDYLIMMRRVSYIWLYAQKIPIQKVGATPKFWFPISTKDSRTLSQDSVEE